MTPMFCMQACETEAHFLHLIREGLIPVETIRVPFAELVDPTITAVRQAVARHGQQTSEEDVRAGLGIREVLVCRLDEPDLEYTLRTARREATGVIVVWDGTIESPSQEQALELLGVARG
jgi:hypothetical protein